MQRYIIFPLFAYIIVCVISILIPASEGYNEVGWKLFIGQVYAIPALVVTGFISYLLYRKNMANK